MNPKDIVRAGYDMVSYAYRGDEIDVANADHRRYVGWIHELLALLPAAAPVLDLGCGNGVPAAKLLADAGCDVTGVDLSPVQIERARANVPQAQFMCADMTSLDIAPDTFAAIISLYAIIHVPLAEQPSLFANIERWLQPGGYLLITVGGATWTGTEEDWLGVADAQMYWSHADQATYQQWLEALGLRIIWTRFIPEGSGGHILMLAQKTSHFGS